MTQHIALIGAGTMGQAIGKRLLETGNALTVFDVNHAAVAALVACGAQAADTAALAAASATTVVLSLNTAQIVELAVFGENGVASGATPDTLIIDMSSIAPNDTADLAARALDAHLHWVDSPLSGGAPKAATGELTLMLGGSDAAVSRARDTLQHLATNITHMGAPGAGQTTKLINQLLCAVGFAAIAEATQLAESAGVDPNKIPTALAGGRADSALLQEYMPRFAQRDYRPTGRIDNMVKDLSGVTDLAQQTRCATPLAHAVAEQHRIMVAAGYGAEDQATLMDYYAGLTRNA